MSIKFVENEYFSNFKLVLLFTMRKIQSTHLIIVQAILFVLFLIITNWFNRYAADDYFFIGELNTKSFKEVYHYLYYVWHGRWSSNFLFLAFLELRNVPYFLMGYFLISYSFLIYGIYFLFKQINTKYRLLLKQQQLILYAFIGFGVFFFCTVNPNETWFWYVSSGVYFWSITSFVFAIAIYFKDKKNVLNYIIYTITLLFVAGSNEPLTAFLGLFFVYQLIKSKSKKINSISLFIIIVSFSVNYLSPGTLNRDEITPNLGLVNWVLYVGYGSIKYTLFTCYKTFIPAILFAVPFYNLGKLSHFKPSHFKPVQQLCYSIIALVIVVIINETLVITVLGGLSPDRAQVSASLFIAFIIIRYVFLFGASRHHKTAVIRSFICFNIIGLITFNIFFFKVHQYYAKKYDERIEFITTPTSQKLIEVSPLPYSGYIYNAELKRNANYFVNQHLKSGLGINADLVLKNPID